MNFESVAIGHAFPPNGVMGGVTAGSVLPILSWAFEWRRLIDRFFASFEEEIQDVSPLERRRGAIRWASSRI